MGEKLQIAILYLSLVDYTPKRIKILFSKELLLYIHSPPHPIEENKHTGLLIYGGVERV